MRYTYGYDGLSQRTSLVAPGDKRTTYSYTGRGLLRSQVNSLQERTTYTYDGAGREVWRQFGNGMAVSHTYYASNNRRIQKQYYSPAGANLALYTTTYEMAGSVRSQVELSGDITTYTWDATYQLLTERRTGSGSYYLTYTYDAVGNRLTKKDNTGTTNNTFNAANELTLLTPPSGASTTFGYDRVGNLTSEVTGSGYTTYTWDVENRLTKYEQGSLSESMLYSLEGLRQQKSSGGVIVAYSWDFLNLLEERDGTGVVQARFTDYPGIWGGLVSENRSGVSSYYGLDLLGNTRILVSSGGVITDSYTYRAFGEDAGTSGTIVNPFRFGGLVGYYYDGVNREYIRSRHYKSELGRWSSADPIGFLGGDVNLYRFVLNGPTDFLDPMGWEGLRDWYMNGMGGLSGWIDTYLMGGSTANFGQTTGNYDVGKASGWDVLGAGAHFGFELATSADMLRAGASLLYKAPQLTNGLVRVARLLKRRGIPTEPVKRMVYRTFKSTFNPKALGVCTRKGDIHLNIPLIKQRALETGKTISEMLRETFVHEKVHQFLTLPTTQSNMWRHELNDVLREAFPSLNQFSLYLEEGLAESIATRNLGEGFLVHPFQQGAYGLTQGAVFGNLLQGGIYAFKGLRAANQLEKNIVK